MAQEKIKINLRGDQILVSKNLLIQESQYFSSLLSGIFTDPYNDKGEIEIDCDPERFRYILRLINQKTLDVFKELEMDDIIALREVLDYYQIFYDYALLRPLYGEPLTRYPLVSLTRLYRIVREYDKNTTELVYFVPKSQLHDKHILDLKVAKRKNLLKSTNDWTGFQLYITIRDYIAYFTDGTTSSLPRRADFQGIQFIKKKLGHSGYIGSTGPVSYHQWNNYHPEPITNNTNFKFNHCDILSSDRLFLNDDDKCIKTSVWVKGQILDIDYDTNIVSINLLHCNDNPRYQYILTSYDSYNEKYNIRQKFYNYSWNTRCHYKPLEKYKSTRNTQSDYVIPKYFVNDDTMIKIELCL